MKYIAFIIWCLVILAIYIGALYAGLAIDGYEPSQPKQVRLINT